ncbi:OTU domain containing [Pseudocyphellaria aurata]|nr:OTU domain containing [Pseudocyphellaria aurata]
MTEQTVQRAFPWIWFIRLLQIFITILVLVLASIDANSVKNFADDCGVPSRIAYNIACAVLAILVLVYLILATGPTKVFKILPWIVWGQIALDAVMLIVWLAAAATSQFTFSQLCDACPYDGFIYDHYRRSCLGYTFVGTNGYVYYAFSKDVSPLLRERAGLERRKGGSSANRASKNGTTLGRTALDSIMTVLFFITLVATILWVITRRRSSGTAASTTRPPPAHEESGVPMTSTQPSAPVGSNPQTQPAQYYVVQGQPQEQKQQQQYAYQQPIPQQPVPQQHVPQQHVPQQPFPQQPIPQQPIPQQSVPQQQPAFQGQYPPQPQQPIGHQQQ